MEEIKKPQKESFVPRIFKSQSLFLYHTRVDVKDSNEIQERLSFKHPLKTKNI